MGGVGLGGGVRVDVNKIEVFFGGWGSGGQWEGSGWGGVRVDVNEELKFL